MDTQLGKDIGPQRTLPSGSQRGISNLLASAAIACVSISMVGCAQYWRSEFASAGPPTSGMRMASMSAETLPPISPVLQWPYEEIPNVPGELEAFRRVQRLSFPAGSNQINDEGRGALLEALPALKTNTRWHLLVVGFTDRGTEATRARELSLARAETVKDWLLANGIEADCVTFSGFGSRYAEGDEYKPATTASDRRVEIWAFMR